MDKAIAASSKPAAKGSHKGPAPPRSASATSQVTRPPTQREATANRPASNAKHDERRLEESSRPSSQLASPTTTPAENEWIAVDVETATPSRDSLCSIAAVHVVDGVPQAKFSELVRPPGNKYATRNMRIHGLTPTDTENSRSAEQVAADFWTFVGPRVLVAHNASFDADVIRQSGERAGVPYPTSAEWFCTLELSRTVWPDLPRYRLPDLCEHLGIESEHHRADMDAIACALVGIELLRVSGSERFGAIETGGSGGPTNRSARTPGTDSPFPEYPRIAPSAWSEEELAQAQMILDHWLAGMKLKDIDQAVGSRTGYSSSVIQRLRKNGLSVPRRSRGSSGWVDEIPEDMKVRVEHLGHRNALAKDTPENAQIVVFTGVLPFSSEAPDRSQIETMAAEAGWLVRRAVTKKTDVLVRCDPTFNGGKVAKATELGTRCMTPVDFLSELMGTQVLGPPAQKGG